MVFPDPVRAIKIVSYPVINYGIAYSYVCVSFPKPHFLRWIIRFGSTLSCYKVPYFFFSLLSSSFSPPMSPSSSRSPRSI